MGLFSHSPDPDDAEHDFSNTPTRRISIPASRRLTAITEDSNTPRPDVPQRNPNRVAAATISGPPSTPPTPRWSNRMPSRFSEDTIAPGLPSYEWVNNPSEEGVIGTDEKMEALRSGRTYGGRGGWGRLLLVAAAVLLIVVALAVGLGVGLTLGEHSGSNGSSSSSGSGSASPSASAGAAASSAAFPVGTFDIDTKLKTVDTACASDSATWTCYGGLDSAISFEWTIANTSASYASENTTLTTSSTGVPANLTISTTGDPFTITFTNETMTYIAPSSNASAARLEFGFTTDKIVYVTSLSGTDGGEAECFFNSTSFLASMYLSTATEVSSASSSSAWPYAINFSQSASGGSNVPNCYDTSTGARVNVTTVSSSDTCVCGYRNY